MLLVFIHGWGVTDTSTYAALPKVLAKFANPRLNIQITDLYLAKYLSFADEVNLDDIARGMQQALINEVSPRLKQGERFACITHSTGGPVVRTWLDLYYKQQLGVCPLSHLIMLAPANHGSALAQLGKEKLARMKFFADGVQAGVGVLNWLELGSDQSWELNTSWLDYDCSSAGLYLFVLTGQTIDRRLYDHLNSYTGEQGSDGVVRVAAANMNYGLLQLQQHENKLKLVKQKQLEKYALAILPGCAHSDTEIGIMGSVHETAGLTHPTVDCILQCLAVNSAASYKKLSKVLAELSARTQSEERIRKTKQVFLFEREFITSRYCMLVFQITDDRNKHLTDYDIFFTAGPDYSENHLPEGFFIDRQRNQLNPGKLSYYLDYDKMSDWMARPELQDKFGFKIVARPATGYAYYVVAQHRGRFSALKQYFEPNQTLMIAIKLTRHVTAGVFQLTQNLSPRPFKDQAKQGDLPEV